MQFVSATTGWVAGTSRVLATTDGGATWTTQHRARHGRYDEVDAINDHNVWIVGQKQLIRTTDGGRHWRRLPEPCPTLSSVHFVSVHRGFGVAGGHLVTTRDGGHSWTAAHAPRGVQSVCFSNQHRGWLGAHGQLYRTATGPGRWKRTSGAVRQSGEPPGDQYTALVECAGRVAAWAELTGGAAASQQSHIGYHLRGNRARPIFAEQYFPHRGVKVKRDSPSAYASGFSSITASRAAFVDTCPACDFGKVELAFANRSGRALSHDRLVRHINSATATAFASTTDGWVLGQRYARHARQATWTIVHTSDGGEHWTTQYSG